MNRFIHRIEAVGSKKELIALLVKAFNCKSMIEDKSERTWKQNFNRIVRDSYFRNEN